VPGATVNKRRNMSLRYAVQCLVPHHIGNPGHGLPSCSTETESCAWCGACSSALLQSASSPRAKSARLMPQRPQKSAKANDLTPSRLNASPNAMAGVCSSLAALSCMALTRSYSAATARPERPTWNEMFLPWASQLPNSTVVTTHSTRRWMPTADQISLSNIDPKRFAESFLGAAQSTGCGRAQREQEGAP